MADRQRRGKRAHRQLDAHEAVADLVGNARHVCLQAPVLGPRKTEKPHARVLTRSHTADRGRRLELRDHVQRAFGHNHRETLRFIDHRADLQIRGFGDPSGDRRAKNAALDFVFKPLDRGTAGRLLSVKV